MKLITTDIQGNIFTSEVLEKVRMGDIRYQSAKDFNLQPNESIRDEISNVWSLLNTHWKIFKQKREALMPTDRGTTITRGNWMQHFFTLLGYEVGQYNAEIINDKSYAISHRAGNKDSFPIHIIGFNQSLDKRVENGVRLSPHALMQEYINNTEYLYGYITNGLQLRILRDATHLSKLSYLEFNLEQMMEEGHFNEFALLYRLLHATRIANSKDDSAESILEFYHNEAIASGARIRERLSDAFYFSMLELANGFLQHTDNISLREQINKDNLNAQEFYAQILKLVYRLLFISVIEERNLIYPSKLTEEEQRFKTIYNSFYSLNRLIKLADKRYFVDLNKKDLWTSVLTTFKLFEDEHSGGKLGIKPLGFGLFDSSAISKLSTQSLSNKVVIEVISLLNYFTNDNGQRVMVNYADLNVEEIGSVYEGLLSLEPVFYNKENDLVSFSFKDGMNRKETASYYTHHDLVKELMQTTLKPLINSRLKKAGTNREAQQQAILDIKVCDPSVGSGHMLLEAARMLSYSYVKVAADAEPTPREYRKAMRLVIQNCLYGVDLNEEAVELCKLALWLEGHNVGSPLSFLDNKIRVGNSLIGIHDPKKLDEAIPNDAYTTNNAEHRGTANALKAKNRNYVNTKQATFNFVDYNSDYYHDLEKESRLLAKQNQNDLEGVRTAERLFSKMRNNPKWMSEWTLCNLWCLPFFAEYSDENKLKIPTTEDLKRFQHSSTALDGRIVGYANSQAVKNKFFHWHLEFPEIYAKGGFDMMIGNPPWERIKVQEKEFFKNKNDDIVNANNAAARKRKIANLSDSNPKLHKEYLDAVKLSDSLSLFIRNSGFFPLTAVGDINLYQIFAELFYTSINSNGRSGIICPTGIATDNNTKDFFAEIVLKDRLISFYDFENRAKLFPIDSRFKFCLLTLGDKPKTDKIKFAFFLHQTTDIQDKERVFELSSQDFININPNTKTSPVFRTQKDADLTSKIYSRLPIIWNQQLNQNIWELSFAFQFHMSNDSHLFQEEYEVHKSLIPLYESKFIWFYNHRNSSYENCKVRTATHDVSEEQSSDPSYRIQPWYWVEQSEVEQKTTGKYYIGFRNIARNTDARTAIFSLVPYSGVGNSMPIVFIENTINKFLFLTQVSSLIFDYVVRQKLGGTNLNFLYIYQFPTLSPISFSQADKLYILPRVAELAYTAWDIKNAFDDLWQSSDHEIREAIKQQHKANALACGSENRWDIPEWADEQPWIAWEKEAGIPLTPFRWNEERRLQLKAELDAYYALLFGLEREELAYMLNPKAVMGEDFPGETFRVLQEKEMRTYGEFRTERLVLEAYDKLRPLWNMPSHLQKLHELWEHHQQDLSKVEAEPTKTKTNYKTKAPKSNRVSEVNGYFSGRLFDEPNLFNQGDE